MQRFFMLFPILILLLMGGLLYPQEAVQLENPDLKKKNWMPEELIKLTNSLLELNAQIKAIDEYAPEKSPDFKNLEPMNQRVDELEFNTRKFELLIKKYNLIEEKIFNFLLKYSQENKNLNELALYLRDFRSKGQFSLFQFQKNINKVALKVERLNRDIQQLQLKAKTDALEASLKDQARKDLDAMTITERIQRFENDRTKTQKALKIEEDLLTEQIKKESYQVAKIKEKRDEIAGLLGKAKKSRNIVERIVFKIKAQVIRERLNGLENLKLNTIKAHLFIIKTKIESLKAQIKKDGNEIKLLTKIRRKEIKNKIIRNSIVIAIILFLVFFLVKLARLISRSVLKRVEKSDKFDAHQKQRYQTLSAVLLSFSKIVIWTIAAFSILGELEVDYGPFLVAAGGISLAIGFGAQSLVKDIVTGFFILIEEQFALGDYVEINGASGTVEKISLRTIRFRSLDGTVHIVPNGNISKVSNSSYKWSRAVVKIGVSYDADTDHVFKALKEVCDTIYQDPELKKKILEEPSVQGILSFEDSCVMFRIMAKTESGGHWAVEREINKVIKRVFDREKIEIPYNIVNVINAE